MIAFFLWFILYTKATQICAEEGQNNYCKCRHNNIYFGAEKSFTKATSISSWRTNNLQCSNRNQKFAYDPKPGVHKYCLCANNMRSKKATRCASEGGKCFIPHQYAAVWISYGARGSWNTKMFRGWTGGHHRPRGIKVSCNNGKFGDPIHGVKKSCVLIQKA